MHAPNNKFKQFEKLKAKKQAACPEALCWGLVPWHLVTGCDAALGRAVPAAQEPWMVCE